MKKAVSLKMTGQTLKINPFSKILKNFEKKIEEAFEFVVKISVSDLVTYEKPKDSYDADEFFKILPKSFSIENRFFWKEAKSKVIFK